MAGASLLLLVICHLSLLSWAEDVTGFNPRCQSLPCGILGNISFPFSNRTYPECGLLMVDDCNKLPFHQKIRFGKDEPSFYITGIKQDNTLVIRDQLNLEPWIFKNGSCLPLQNFTLPRSPLYSFELLFNLTKFRCPRTITNHSIPANFEFSCNEPNYSIIHYNYTKHPQGSSFPSPPAGCSIIDHLVTKTQNHVIFHNIYAGWFFLQVNVTKECDDCYRGGGRCLSDSNGKFNCTGAKTDVTRFNPKCPSLPCGILGNISFPFSNRTHPECGLFMVDDCNKPFDQKIQLGKDVPSFYISDIKQNHTVTLHELEPSELLNNLTCGSFKNYTLSSSPFYSFEVPSNVSMLKCLPTSDSFANPFRVCNDSSHSIFFNNQSIYNSLSPSAQCSVIQPLVIKTQKNVFLHNIYSGIFFLQVNVTKECYDCYFGGGECQRDNNGNFNCSGAKTGRSIIKVAVAATASGVGILIIILVFCFRKKNSSDNSMTFWRKKTKNYQNIEAFIRNYGSLAPKRYSYSQIKKMTNSFKVKLGQGGYGGVYKGRLHDGRDVAVKVLNESKGNGEEFINEVASISRTSHVNVVGLFGYCFQGRKRALIYEFVPNGSLEKFIYQKNPNYKQLKWEKLYQIAVGIARGLEYLHRGCNTRILHFDIKPHNILLDKNFSPKISDFGLAKIFPGRESIIPMTGARGTIGYIAPEVCCREFGEVSYKSDVYSYGMMVLEMAGGRKNLDVRVGKTSEIYFPHWVYERLEVDEELGLQGIENEEDKESASKMIIVSLWCIQTNPSSRPAMNRVVEMLEGSLDSLRIPPKPFMYSSRSQSQTPDSSASASLIY